MKGFLKFAALCGIGLALLFFGGWRVSEDLQPKLDAAETTAKRATERADAAEQKLATYKPPECPAVSDPLPQPKPAPVKRKPRLPVRPLVFK